ncbi:hypothetical protein P9112_012908 [Eukaryota sp. TZLM1-RC]
MSLRDLLQQCDHVAINEIAKIGDVPSLNSVLYHSEATNALHHAVKSVCYQTVRVLLEMGCNPNAKDSYGSLPLMYAVQSGCVGITILLLDYGAELDLTGQERDDLVKTLTVEVVDILNHYG